MNDFRVFIDTGPFLAHFNPSDQYHQQSLKTWMWIEQQELVTITTNHVLDELATLLARRTAYSFAAVKMREIYRSSIMIERSHQEDEEEALRFFEKYSDQKVSFTDCISFAILERLNIRTCFTFDRHFTDAGFETIPTKY
ncbi:MAG: PIN domain-containing protein [SAR324 cluster bacterium]|nr:PIN domain-containing protein [SAR324 cluster bacterium]